MRSPIRCVCRCGPTSALLLLQDASLWTIEVPKRPLSNAAASSTAPKQPVTNDDDDDDDNRNSSSACPSRRKRQRLAPTDLDLFAFDIAPHETQQPRHTNWSSSVPCVTPTKLITGNVLAATVAPAFDKSCTAVYTLERSADPSCPPSIVCYTCQSSDSLLVDSLSPVWGVQHSLVLEDPSIRSQALLRFVNTLDARLQRLLFPNPPASDGSSTLAMFLIATDSRVLLVELPSGHCRTIIQADSLIRAVSPIPFLSDSVSTGTDNAIAAVTACGQLRVVYAHANQARLVYWTTRLRSPIAHSGAVEILSPSTSTSPSASVAYIDATGAVISAPIVHGTGGDDALGSVVACAAFPRARAIALPFILVASHPLLLKKSPNASLSSSSSSSVLGQSAAVDRLLQDVQGVCARESLLEHRIACLHSHIAILNIAAQLTLLQRAFPPSTRPPITATASLLHRPDLLFAPQHYLRLTLHNTSPYTLSVDWSLRLALRLPPPTSPVQHTFKLPHSLAPTDANHDSKPLCVELPLPSSKENIFTPDMLAEITLSLAITIADRTSLLSIPVRVFKDLVL